MRSRIIFGVLAALAMLAVVVTATATGLERPVAHVQDRTQGGGPQDEPGPTPTVGPCSYNAGWVQVDWVTIEDKDSNEYLSFQACRNLTPDISEWDKGNVRIQADIEVDGTPPACFDLGWEQSRLVREVVTVNETPRPVRETGMENGDLSEVCGLENFDELVVTGLECRDQWPAFDGVIVTGDISEVVAHYGEVKPLEHVAADVTKDGAVGIGDIGLVVQHYGGDCGDFE